ncbi:MAG: FRG domain-containing protein [Ferruginibacter sp.]
MRKVYQAANVEAAVEMAIRFKEEGRYDWFRGQVAEWPPHSSLWRRQGDDEKFAEADFRFRYFMDWIAKIPELAYLLKEENTDQREAIMQHYGIPTDYIDFTTDPGVAGFFAADCAEPPVTGNACIYCVDSAELLKEFTILKEAVPERASCQIRKVIIDVSNLWRLQAQRGVFLYANYNWDIDFDLDRIIFPYSGYPSYPTKEEIYPSEKSQLELLLDQFHDRLRTASLHQAFHNIAHFMSWESFPDGFYAPAFLDPASMQAHESWAPEKLKAWFQYPVEKYADAVGLVKKINLENSADATEIETRISYAVRQVIQSDISIRNKAVEWRMVNNQPGMDTTMVSKLIAEVWNGMRLAPYSPEAIGFACGRTVRLYLSIEQSAPGISDKQLLTPLLGECMKVSFAYPDSSGSSAFAGLESIRQAYAIDLVNSVTEEYRERAAKVFDSFTFIYNPRILFDFEKFTDLFVKEIIPIQVAFRKNLVVFNPAKLITFGIP